MEFGVFIGLFFWVFLYHSVFFFVSLTNTLTEPMVQWLGPIEWISDFMSYVSKLWIQLKLSNPSKSFTYPFESISNPQFSCSDEKEEWGERIEVCGHVGFHFGGSETRQARSFGGLCMVVAWHWNRWHVIVWGKGDNIWHNLQRQHEYNMIICGLMFSVIKFVSITFMLICLPSN